MQKTDFTTLCGDNNIMQIKYYADKKHYADITAM